MGQSTGLPPVRTWDGDIKHVLKRTSVLIVAISKLTNLNHQKGFITVAEFGSKISHILSELNLKHPLSIFAATGGGIYRKPLTGVVDTFYQDISISESVMVGDGAGRYSEETGFYTDWGCS